MPSFSDTTCRTKAKSDTTCRNARHSLSHWHNRQIIGDMQRFRGDLKVLAERAAISLVSQIDTILKQKVNREKQNLNTAFYRDFERLKKAEIRVFSGHFRKKYLIRCIAEIPPLFRV